MRIDVAARKDFIGGGLVLVIGLATVLQAFSYDLGTLRRMGPGFFPLALGVILAVTGLLIILAGQRPGATAPASTPLRPEWRGWFCICVGLAAFIVIGAYRGLLPATFATVFISALGDRQNSVLAAFVLAVAMTLVCLVVFWWLLQVQLPLFR